MDKNLKVQNLTMVPRYYATMNDILPRDILKVEKHKYWEAVNKTMMNYELVIQGLINHFFRPNALQHQKRYLHR